IEELGNTDNVPTSKVLISKLEKDGALYAVEPVQAGIYALCKLAGWVKIGNFVTHGLNTPQPPLLPGLGVAEEKETESNQWWARAAIKRPLEEETSHRPTKKFKLSMAPPAVATKSPATRDQPSRPAQFPQPQSTQPPSDVVDPVQSQPSPEQIYESL